VFFGLMFAVESPTQSFMRRRSWNQLRKYWKY
jgi:hypothetical protein